jgi:ABC-2 type transport system ATP-binding protein
MTQETVVEARSLCKSYGPITALDEVSFEVRKGEIFGLIGADGAGKTTAFRIIGGVLQEGGGAIHVLGVPPREARPRVGYLTQPFSLYQDLSVDENVNYAAVSEKSPIRIYPRDETGISSCSTWIASRSAWREDLAEG